MSCSSSCPCQFKWPMDTLGSKRDPINSEKAWLDFAVRLLSREVVRKGKGQETVWSERCKPQWWDQAVGVAWKNPTANPKDTKEVLLKKYIALEKHLQEEGRFPAELTEEAQLWNSGKYRELFLLTTLTSLLGKVTAVHSAVLDAYSKVDELKAQVNQDLLNDIKSCLTSTLQATENFKCKSSILSTPKTLKRPNCHSGKENNVIPPAKCQKLTEIPSFESSKALNISVDRSTKPCQELSREVLNYLEKFIAKRKSGKVASRPVKECQKKIQPKPFVAVPTPVTTVTETPATATSSCPSTQSESLTDCITLSQEQVDSLFQGGKIIICSQPGTNGDSYANPSNLPHVPSMASDLSALNSSLVSSTPFQENPGSASPIHQKRNETYDYPIKLCPKSQSSVVVDHPQSIATAVAQSSESHFSSGSDLNSPLPANLVSSSFDILELLDSNHTPENNLKIENETLDMLCRLPSSTSNSPMVAENESDFDSLGNECSRPAIEFKGSRTSNKRIGSSGSGSDFDSSQISSDSGYSSESSAIDLDLMLSPEECQQLLGEDDYSYLGDKFLEELNGSSDTCDLLSLV